MPSVAVVVRHLSLRQIRFSLLPAILACVLLPVAARAQVSYTGTAGTQNFGSHTIGSTSAARTFNFSVAAGTTVGSIGVVTQGAPNLDFTDATGSTCTVMTYVSASTCTVNVTFKPRVAGTRTGAVVFFSAAGNTGTVLGSVLIYGIGTGPQIAYGSAPGIAIDPTVNGLGLPDPNAAAVDGAGNLFIADTGNSRVVEVPAGGGAAIAIEPTVNGEGLNVPQGIAVDGAGDLFIADTRNRRVIEMPAGGSAAIAIGPVLSSLTLQNPVGLTVDGVGDLFIADFDIGMVEIPAGGGTPLIIAPTANGKKVTLPYDVAVDGAGDLFISDPDNKRVVEVPVGGGAAIAINPSVDGLTLEEPLGIAVDGAGDLFISDFYIPNGDVPIDNRIVEVPAGGGAAIAIDPTVNGESLNVPEGVSLDSTGDLFISDAGNGRVVEVQRSQPATLNFQTPTDVGTTDTADGTQTMQVQNIGNEALTLTGLSYPADFSEGSGEVNPCTGSTSLSAGQECAVSVEFTPDHSGPLSESVTLTDNALNAAGTQQLITVSGTGKGADHFSVSTTASVAAGNPFTITVTALSSTNQTFTSYNGTATFTSSDPLFVNPGPLTLSNGTGNAVVTLKTLGTQSITATDTVAPALSGFGTFLVGHGTAVLTSPMPGSTLGTSNVTFTWTVGYGVTNYGLWLGLNGPGSSDLYSSGVTTATSATVSNLPAKGMTVYARFYSLFNGVWYYTDYTYTETTGVLATMTSPTPTSTLGTSNVTFTWTAGTGVTHYALWLGLSGPGSSDLYASGTLTTTSTTVPSLPARGAAVYARLYSEVDGVFEPTDYTYTEQ